MGKGIYTRKPKHDLTGVENNLFKILEFSHFEKKQAHWKLQCKCNGKTHIVSYKRLRESNFNINRLCPDIERKDESAFNSLYNRYKYGAKTRNLAFELTKDVFKSLTKLNCAYCNQIPSNIEKQVHGIGGTYIYNGIDRIDNKNGYTIENSVTCCSTCNHAKAIMGYNEFITWINNVYTHLKKLGEL